MSLPELRDRQEGFAGGLNTTSDDAALANNECRIARNAQLDRRGAVEKRQGTQRILASPLAAAVLGGTSWARTSAVNEVLIANGRLYTGTLGLPTTLTDRGGTFSTTVYPTFAVFKGPSAEGVYIADGGPISFWDGTTLTENIAGTPNVDAITAWGPRLFAVAGDTLFWSGTTGGINGHTLGNAGSGGGQAIVRTYGGQNLVGLAPLKNSLLLFHRSAISRFTGATTDDINIEAGTNGISGDVGTVSKRSIISVENVVYFLSDRGVFAATETNVEPVSSPLESTLANLTKTQWLQVSAVHARAFNEVRWAIPDVGVYVYNYRTQGWSGPWDGAFLTSGVTAMWETTDSDGKAVVLTGHANGHVLWNDRTNTYLDNVTSAGTGGTTYTFQVQCKRFFAQDYTTYKSWRTLYVLGDFRDPANTTCTVTSAGSTVTTPLPYSAPAMALTLTWGNGTTTWGAAGTTWGGATAGSIERGRLPMHGTHPWADVTFTYTGDRATRISIVDVVGFNRGRR